MKIDSHNHFWKFDPIRDAWIDDSMSIIRRDFFPEDFAPLLFENKIDGTVAVQADQSLTETEFLLDIASKNQFVKGVVGWIDLQADNVTEQLEKYKNRSLLKGFRHIAQSEPNDFLTRDVFMRGIAALDKTGFTYDILIYPQQLPAAIRLVDRFSDQPFVIDHIAKPLIKDQVLTPWAVLIPEIAQNPNVYCKVSGLITEADLMNWKPADFRPYLDIVFEAFGPQRLLFGSDWPVCLLAGSYSEVVKLLDDYCQQFSDEEQELIWGGNAIRFYNL